MLNQNMRKDPYFSYYKDIDTITEPLKKYFGITYFAYKVIYEDNSKLYLGNTPILHEAYYNDKWRVESFFEFPFDYYNSGFFFSEDLSKTFHPEYLSYMQAKHYNTDFFCIIKKNCNYTEFFYFGSKKDNVIKKSCYINHLDLLESFTLCFKNNAYKIIEKSKLNKIMLPSHKNSSLDIMNFKTLSFEDKKAFLHKILQNKIYINYHGKSITISKRELQSLQYLINYKTAKEIGKLMSISNRTAETYLDRLKNKLNCRSQAELVQRVIYDETLLLLRNYIFNCRITDYD